MAWDHLQLLEVCVEGTNLVMKKSHQKMAQEWRTEAEDSRETEEMSG